MANNRRRNINTVPILAIATWVVVLSCLGGAGLGFVYLKNESHTTGSKIKALESELLLLKMQDEATRAKIASLSSRAALQRRVNEGFIKLVAISDDRLVRMDVPARQERSELRAVSNERARE